MKELWGFDKFWLIWTSCVDKPKTIKGVQKEWDYRGNSLYQKGRKKPIWEEMIDEGFLERRGRVVRRGVSGILLYSKLDWIPDYLKKTVMKFKFNLNNSLPADLYDCFPDKSKLIKFLEGKRIVFFFIKNLKILFGDKENLRKRSEMSIFAPLLVIFDLFLLTFLKEELSLEKDTLYIASQPLIFHPCFSLNFLDYFKAITKEIKPEDIPPTILSKRKTLELWKKYTDRVYSNL